MVKVKQFNGSVLHPNPQKAMEKFIKGNNIRANQIISAVPVSTTVGKSISVSMTLTYDDGQQ
jgi:Tfp pilus assembly PilM family ATPase